MSFNRLNTSEKLMNAVFDIHENRRVQLFDIGFTPQA
jgi:hypothetical protein